MNVESLIQLIETVEETYGKYGMSTNARKTKTMILASIIFCLKQIVTSSVINF